MSEKAGSDFANGPAGARITEQQAQSQYDGSMRNGEMRMVQTALGHGKMAVFQVFTGATAEVAAGTDAESLQCMPGFQSYAYDSRQILGMPNKMQGELRAGLKAAPNGGRNATSQSCADQMSLAGPRCGDATNPTLGLEVGKTYEFVQEDRSN